MLHRLVRLTTLFLLAENYLSKEALARLDMLLALLP